MSSSQRTTQKQRNFESEPMGDKSISAVPRIGKARAENFQQNVRNIKIICML